MMKFSVSRLLKLSAFILLFLMVSMLSFSGSFNPYSSHRFNDFDTVAPASLYRFYVSNQGSNGNDGLSALTPRRNFSSIEASTSNLTTGASGLFLNLDGNSLFREQYNLNINNVSVSSYGLNNSKKLAKITGMDVVKEWNKAPGSTAVYQYLLNHSIELGAPTYNYVMIAEIDTALETTHPISAVKYLTYVSSVDICNSVPGSYYTPNIVTNPVMIYMHPSEGTPGNNRFRYEVSTRNYNINGFYFDNASYRNLFLQTSGNGYGMLSAGKNTTVKQTIFQGGGTHHTVIKSGSIDSCLFLPGPKGLADQIAAVFYSPEGTDGNNSISNSIFLDVRTAVYAHTNGVVNHKSLVLKNVYAFADTTAAVNGLSAYDTDSIDVSDCYVEGYPTGWYGGGTRLNIANSIFRNTNQSAILVLSKSNVKAQVNINNVLIKTRGTDQNQNLANGWTAYGLRSIYNNVNVEMSNSIIHDFSTWHGPYQTVTTIQVAGALKAHHNIYVCDVNSNNSVYMYLADNTGGRGTSSNVSSDYNAFVLLRGSKFNWTVSPNNNGESSISTLSEWQSLTGQDKNSIVIDLRNNPLGLKAIFVDPDNGNYTLTQTRQADSVRQIAAGMKTPPLFYPIRPSKENDGTPFKTPGGFSSFIGSLKSESESSLQWQTFNESNFSSFILEYSFDGIIFKPAGTLRAINDNSNHNYQFNHTHERIDSIFYRLKSIFADSSSLYSSPVKLSGDFSQESKINIYPNPFQQVITVDHPRRGAATISIFDYEGRLLKIVNVITRSSHTLIPLNNFPSGRYFVQWKSNKEKLSGTIIR